MKEHEDNLLNVVETVRKHMEEYGVVYDDVMKRWGVQKSVDVLNDLFKNPPMGLDAFVHSWMKMLNANLESAIWLCVYERYRLETTQKEAMKMADDALKNYNKETKNAF